ELARDAREDAALHDRHPRAGAHPHARDERGRVLRPRPRRAHPHRRSRRPREEPLRRLKDPMARLRYVKDLGRAPAARAAAGATSHTVRSLRARYLTHPEIVAALLPRPLEPADEPEVFVQFAHVAMHVSPEKTVEIGAATVAVACRHEGAFG